MSLKTKQFIFGQFTLDAANNLLLHRQQAVPLPPKAFDTLVYLVENNHRLVTRDELMKAVWPDSFVEDANLTVNVSVLRKALGEFEDGRPYIETVPRRGYRFNAEVRLLDEESEAARARIEPPTGPARPLPAGQPGSDPAGRNSLAAAAVARQPVLHEVIAFPEPKAAAEPPQRPELPPRAPESPSEGGRHGHRRWVLAGIIILAAICLAAGWLLRHRPRPPAAFQQIRLTSFASPMAVSAAAISTGGKFIAYANPAGLFIQVIDGGETHPLQLPEPGFTVSSISWFPDSAELLVGGSAPQHDTQSLWVVPVIGASPVSRIGPYGPGVVSPDGSEIALVDRAGVTPKIEVMRSDGTDWRTLLTGAVGETFGNPSWSHGGRHVLFTRYRWDSQFRRNSGSIDSCDLSSGNTTTVLAGFNFAGDVASLPDGRIVYSTIPTFNPAADGGELWAVPTDSRTGRASGAPSVIAKWDSPLTGLTVNRAGNRLAVRDLVVQHNTYLGDLEDGGTRLANVRRFSFVAGSEDLPRAWAPGSRAVFIDSNRFGHWEIFRRSLDGGADAPFVHGAGDQFSPRLGPEGQWLLYLSRPVKWQEPQPVSLMRAPLAGGASQFVLTSAGYSEWGLRFECPRRAGMPCVLAERQGSQIAFRAFDPAKGFESRGAAIGHVPVASQFHFAWALAPDLSSLAWIQWSPVDDHIHVLPLAYKASQLSTGGSEYRVTAGGEAYLHSIAWARDARGWYLTTQQPARWTLIYATLTGKVSKLLRVPSPLAPDVFPSPDGRHLAFSEESSSSNVWLLENF